MVKSILVAHSFSSPIADTKTSLETSKGIYWVSLDTM